MVLFISYSSRDHAALEKVKAGLHRARLQAWLDEELSGGEAWWNTILEQIRECEVFIVALSKNYLESKPCKAELRYAQDLNRPILPVQIGPLDSMRVNPLSAVQAIDYQNPSIDSGIELVTAVHARRATVEPLPVPLPDPPPVPFAYLLRLDTAIAAPELGVHEQAEVLSDLKSGLETDGHEPSARRDLTQLLIKLRERPDVTWKTRTDVDAVLTSIQTKEPPPPPSSSLDSGPLPSSFASGPPPSSFDSGPPPSSFDSGPPPSSGGFGPPPTYLTGPQPMPMPPYGAPHTGAGKPRMSRKRWIIAGGAVAAVAVAVAVIVLAIPNPPPPPPPPVTSQPASPVSVAALDGLLLSPDQIGTAVGVTGIVVQGTYTDLFDDSATVADVNCRAVDSVQDASTYANSGWTAVRRQQLQVPAQGDAFTFVMKQGVASFPSANAAAALFTTVTQRWTDCSNRRYTVTGPQGGGLTTGPISNSDGTLSITETAEGGNGWACQRALTVANNVAIDVVTCSFNPTTDSAANIAHQIAAKVPTQ
jgi:serine/threonine kinase PknH